MFDALQRRQSLLRADLAAGGFDAMVISGAANIRYLSGFTGSAAQLMIAADHAVLVTDFRYAAQSRVEVEPGIVVRIERGNHLGALRQSLQAIGARRIAVDRARLTLAEWHELRQLGSAELEPVTGVVERLRASKDPGEVASIRAAAALATEALASVLDFIAPGRTELEIAAELEAALRRRGSEWHPFQSIVASGPRSALPHARSTSRTVERGDWLVVDFGAQVDGYCSDITRTFVVGARADERQWGVYRVVQEAQAVARAGIRAGMTGRQADALARDLLDQAGFGDAFGHSLGHGIGLEVHEEPRLSQTNAGTLPAGAVVTVEPGVYFEDWGGIRIEDDVLLTADGAECLSDGRTDLMELT